MFDALAHHKIDTEGLTFEVVMEDVEALNLMAAKEALDISKLSFAAFTRLTEHYQLLNAGSAMGLGVGPLVVSEKPLNVIDIKKNNPLVAIPGKNTTANFLFSVFFPEAKNKKEMVFSEIEHAVLSGEAMAGVIIHENRFTYEKKGLKKVCDLGELWQKETGQPIPLGGIAVKRNLPGDMKNKIDRIIRKSVEYAFANPDSSKEYVKEHAQEMDAHVRRKHIETYVNDFSVALGPKGREAIEILFLKAKEAGMISSVPNDIFVDESPGQIFSKHSKRAVSDI